MEAALTACALIGPVTNWSMSSLGIDGIAAAAAMARNTFRPAVPAEARGGPFPCPGIAGLVSFTLRVNEARLAN
jgi:hypothetical protein